MALISMILPSIQFLMSLFCIILIAHNKHSFAQVYKYFKWHETYLSSKKHIGSTDNEDIWLFDMDCVIEKT